MFFKWDAKATLGRDKRPCGLTTSATITISAGLGDGSDREPRGGDLSQIIPRTGGVRENHGC